MQTRKSLELTLAILKPHVVKNPFVLQVKFQPWHSLFIFYFQPRYSYMHAYVNDREKF